MKNYIHVCVGDTIKVVFTHYRPHATLVGVVKEITERIDGDDLIEVDPISDERPPRISEIPSCVHNSFSIHFVKEIINRPKQKGRYIQRPPKNSLVLESNFAATIRKGVKAGTLLNLTMEAMKKASIEVIYVDFEKTYKLWEKQKPGLLKKMYDIYYVHWEPFQKWVLRNQSKLIRGRRSIKKEIDERNKEYDKAYWKSVDQELEKDRLLDILDKIDEGCPKQLDEDYKLYYN